MNSTFENSTVRSLLWTNIFKKNINIKSPSLFGSRIVGETVLKSLSILFSSAKSAFGSFHFFFFKSILSMLFV